jgi:hypothetical protein
MLAAPTTASFVDIHRFLVTPCVHANRYVPDSSSRATSGAPQNNPRSAGKSKLKAWAKGKYVSCPLVSELVIDSQSPLALHVFRSWNRLAKCGPVMRKTTATATRRPKTTRA